MRYTSAVVDLPSESVAQYCRREGIRRLAVFGSHLHGTATADSDIDLLIEFEPGRSIGLLTLARLTRELSLIVGRPVDLRTLEDLSRYFRDRVAGEARVIYEAA
ncbi:MAG: nucleotidyltransferase family protein [Phycisphaeraceae bacterium]|nr:MAG: nucleotidyltransferase family protein [Phycisphaeraceae bacterium]